MAVRYRLSPALPSTLEHYPEKVETGFPLANKRGTRLVGLWKIPLPPVEFAFGLRACNAA
jgi:hypothetical protein